VKQAVEKEIPYDTALELCDEICEENGRKLFSIWKTQCFFCYRTAQGDPQRLCIFAHDLNRGYPQVNRRYEERYAS
jgi:hypothetical protein